MRKKIFKYLRKWHGRIGLMLSTFILLLAVTGVLLNHSDDWKLSSYYLNSPWLLAIYGIKGPVDITLYQIRHKAIFTADDQLWFDDKLIQKDSTSLKAVTFYHGIYIVFLENEFLLLSENGELIDKVVKPESLPKDILALAVDEKNIYTKTTKGIFYSNEALLNWHPEQNKLETLWSKPQELSQNIKTAITNKYRSHIITWERFIQDVHSGRILQRLGKWLMDIVAFLFIVLAVSGIYMWGRKKKK